MYDLIIVGGGLVGASLALGLAQTTELKILVLEQKEVSTKLIDFNKTDDFAQKTLAINQGTKLFFDKLDIWPVNPGINNFLTPIKSVKVSMQKAFGQFQFNTPKKQDALGYIIAINLLEQLLLNKIKNNPSYREKITWVQPSSNLSMKPMISGWQVDYVDAAKNKIVQVQAKCIIGSDGPSSVVKKSLGISDKIFDYGHVAMIANVKLNQHHEYIAYERFTEEGGALALLPYGPDAQMTLVLTIPTQQAQMYQALSDQDFLIKLGQIMGGRLKFEEIGPKIQVPLGMKIATHQTARRAILMGNSAHFLHPIAAQGFNLSIQDIVSLIRIIGPQENIKEENNIGSAQMLSHYEQARIFTQKQYIQTTDNIAQYYSSQRLPGCLKGMSLFMLDSLPVKQYFTQKSMGII